MRFFSLGFTFNILHDLLKKSLRQTLVTVKIFCKTDTCDCYKGDNTKSYESILSEKTDCLWTESGQTIERFIILI